MIYIYSKAWVKLGLGLLFLSPKKIVFSFKVETISSLNHMISCVYLFLGDINTLSLSFILGLRFHYQWHLISTCTDTCLIFLLHGKTT